MFSKRLSWSFEPNRLSRLLQKKRHAGEEILDLTQSNPTRAQLDYPEEDILAALLDRRALVYEPAPCGLETARVAVARYYADRGRELSPEDILLTASTSEAYAFLFKTLGNPGDEILIPRPCYPLFEYLAALESLEAISYPLNYDGCWSLDLDAVEKAIGSRARAILLVHPGNPTGAYLKRDELEHLSDVCRRHQLALIVDEVFLDYGLSEDPERVGSLAGGGETLTFVLSGLSKVAGLPQMKLSWICTGGPEGARRQAQQRLEHVSDLFLSVGAQVQHAAERLFELGSQLQSAISARVVDNLRFLRESISETSPINLLPVEGGWYAVLRLPALRTSEEWALELLSSDHVYVHPGYLFEFPTEAHMVVSLLSPLASFQTGIQRLLQRVDKSLMELKHL